MIPNSNQPNETMPKKKTGIDLNHYTEFMVARFFPANKRLILTIVDVVDAAYYNRKTPREDPVPALVFDELRQKLKLTSHMNCEKMADLFGANGDAWIGKRIILERRTDRKTMDKDSLQIVGEAPATAASDSADDFLKGLNATPARPTSPKAARKANDPATQFWVWVNEFKVNKQAASAALSNASGDYDQARRALSGETPSAPASVPNGGGR